MNLLDKIKDFFRIGGAKLGMVQELAQITDDPRISIPSSEYERIKVAKEYYANDLKEETFRNAKGRAYQRQLNSLNVTKMAARSLASIIFNQGCEVTVDDDNANKLIQHLIKTE